ncbi:MAG TPA: hypothetical protein V6C78_34250 [Crinalium sp.]|jgi:hypothetical protein
MLLQIQPKSFAIAYITYVFFSFVIYLITANTIPAWIVYLFVLAPFYLLCAAHVISVAWTKRNCSVQLRKNLLWITFVFQGLMIASSPGSCYGVNQGQACYSFIQALFVDLFTNENLRQFGPNVMHWSYVESAFPFMVGLYMLSMIFVLGLLHFVPHANR